MIFITISEKVPFRKNKKIRTLLFLPLIVSVVLMIALYAANPTFWISEKGELNSVYYILMLAVPLFYLIITIVVSINSIRKAESPELKKQYWMNVFIPIGVLVAGLIQVISLNVPTFCFGCTIMWIWFYIQNLQNLISIDALTRLNNRGEINRYMEQISYRDNAKVYAMMIDVDRFKEINDMYGHEEGDRALMLVSEALKQTCDRIKTPLFIGRYGGDEFVVLYEEYKMEEIDKMVRILRQKIHDLNIEHRYSKVADHITISQGLFHRIPTGSNKPWDFLHCADMALYGVKARARDSYYIGTSLDDVRKYSEKAR
jgi:diguanylate cyclase (GGDEF)-like protein